MTEPIPEHLIVTTSDRGFDCLPPIPSDYGGQVEVYESSAAIGPCVWLSATAPVDLNEQDGPRHRVPIHLTAEDALRLADQLRFLVAQHYQGSDVPPPTAEMVPATWGGGMPMYRHDCGGCVEGFAEPPANEGCDACESGAGGWVPLYVKADAR
jgi:hypothetical protein